jgi:GDPmannose 4,6-dehydratase
MRAHDGLFACSGILYNHESERRPLSFVPRKITHAAAAIKLGLADQVSLGDLDAVRDWSFAEDIMTGAWLTLQQDRPDDYILASGVPHTVADLAEVAFAHAGLDAREHIQVDPALVRPPEPTPIVGDPTHAREQLGWRPTLTFEQLIQRMVDADLLALDA